jgi:hypothetical protein
MDLAPEDWLDFTTLETPADVTTALPLDWLELPTLETPAAAGSAHCAPLDELPTETPAATTTTSAATTHLVEPPAHAPLPQPLVRVPRPGTTRDRGASARLTQLPSLSLAVMPQGWHRVPVFRSEGGLLVMLETHAERYSLRRAGVCVPCCRGARLRRVFRTRLFDGSVAGFQPQGDWRVTTQRELEQVDRDYGRCFSVLAVRTTWVATVEAVERWLRLPSTLAAEQEARECCSH